MKVALIADESWLRHEARLLRHLTVGLADESVRFVAVVPEGARLGEQVLTDERITYRPGPAAWVSRWRLRRLGGDLADQQIDLLHALDGSLAAPAMSLAKSLGVPLACNSWSLGQAVAAGRVCDASSALLVPTTPMYRAAADKVAGPVMRVLRPGVMRSDAPPPLNEPEQMLCCLLILDGRVDAATINALHGLAAAAKELEQLQVFVYATEHPPHRLWQLASKLGLAGQANLVGADAGSQRLAIRADLVLVPQAVGMMRSFLPQAMAGARPVIAAPSEMADFLIDGQTARLIPDATAGDWTRLVRQAAADPVPWRQLGEGGQAYIRDHFSPAAFVADTLEVYRQLVGEPLKFEA